MEFTAVFTSYLALCTVVSCQYSCRDETGNPIDWFYIYKLPVMAKSSNVLLRWGVAFMYLDEMSTDHEWTLSGQSLNSSKHPVAYTLSQYYNYKEKPDILYMLYNDDHPGEKEDAYRGHTKGVLLVGPETGLWLIHSVPEFPSTKEYFYPQSGTKNGQSMLCFTFETEKMLPEIGRQLFYTQPSIFESSLPAEMAQKYPDIAKVIAKKSATKGPNFTRHTTLYSAKGVAFESFAKHKKWGKDLWNDFIAIELSQSMYVETWLNGPGDLPSICQPDSAHNVRSVKVGQFEFTSSKDHSKWGVATQKPIICVGDINRQASQSKRGGGALCKLDSNIWNAYRETVVKLESCKNDSVYVQPPPFYASEALKLFGSHNLFSVLSALFSLVCIFGFW